MKMTTKREREIRDLEICEQLRRRVQFVAGDKRVTHDALARKFGITRQRVGQIWRRDLTKTVQRDASDRRDIDRALGFR